MSETIKQGDTVLVDGKTKATVLAVAAAAQRALVRPDRDSDTYRVSLDRLTLVR